MTVIQKLLFKNVGCMISGKSLVNTEYVSVFPVSCAVDGASVVSRSCQCWRGFSLEFVVM